MPLGMKSYTKGTVACLDLVGELDAAGAADVRDALEQLLAARPLRLMLYVERLTFMASAGLRLLIFAKQKQPEVQIYLYRPQPPIVETLKKTGFYESVYILEQELGDAAG
jgi:anti-anti-sigma factor